ncbi:MAG: hypothetical protein WBG50_19415 [Desulfomonilaceae bacterium]
MKKRMYAIAILIGLALAVNLPNVSMAAQNSQSSQGPTMQSNPAVQPGQAPSQSPAPSTPVTRNQATGGGQQVPQPKGGVAKVIGVDHPDNCLRIRSGPGNQYDVIGCANMDDQLNITGVWTSNDWAQLADNGWVYGQQISTDLQPPRTAYSRPPTYVASEEAVPDYDDWAYLPDYGYDTYWDGDVPIYFYNVAIWNWCHPWWWWQGLQAWWWQDGFYGRRTWNDPSFRNFARTRGVNVAGAERANMSALNRMGRTTNSPSIAPSNVSKFNANRSNIKSSNLNRLNTNRFNTSGKAFRSRTYSGSHGIHTGSARAFRSPRSSSFGTSRGGSFGGAHFGGFGGGMGGAHFGGGGMGGAHFGGGGGRHR